MLALLARYGTDAAQKGMDGRDWSDHSMMWSGKGGGVFWVHMLMALITWVLVIAVLFALARWLWKKGDKVK